MLRVFKGYSHIFLIVSILFIFVGLLIWIKFSDSYLRKYGVEVIATVGDTGGKSVSLLYQFKGNSYKTVVGLTNRTMQDGEKYTILVDRDDPTDVLADFSKPIFDTTQYRKIDNTSIKKLWFSGDVQFDYIFEGTKHTRFQRIPDGSGIDRLTNDTKVYVNPHTPDIAYLVFKR